MFVDYSRMLVMGGGAKVANEMVDDDIMTPLDALFAQIVNLFKYFCWIG
jgi:hypothetical protein